MQYALHTTFDTVDRAAWKTLLKNSTIDSPFLQYGYQRIWWEHQGGGEWPQADLAIVTATNNDNELAGIAPLFLDRKSQKLLFIGSIEISDYLDFICSPQQMDLFLRGLLRFIKEGHVYGVQHMRLYNIPDHSPSITSLTKIEEEGPWDVAITQAYHTPAIPLPGDWDTYLAEIDKKQRHEIRRKMRRSRDAQESITWYIANDPSQMHAEIESFFDLMKFDPHKVDFLTKVMEDQMRAILNWAYQAGVLQLSFLTIDGNKAAGYICLDYGNRMYVYNSGYDPAFRSFSPGWVLLSYLIQHAISSKKKVFDFMRGDEKYKYKFGGRDSFVMKAEIRAA